MTKYYETKYGYFDDEGSYNIKTAMTPKPWINVISNGTYGLTFSQNGGGFSWYIHSNFNRINRWFQDMVKDDWGKFIFIKDNTKDKFWSISYKPTMPRFKKYHVKHSFGYSEILSEYNGVQSNYSVFVPLNDSLEVWTVKIKNTSKEVRNLSLFTYLEWSLGDAPDSHREFFKTFIETDCKNEVIQATKRMWGSVKGPKGGHNNKTWDYVAYHFSGNKLKNFDTEKENFIGKYRELSDPIVADKGKLKKSLGKYNDSIGSLQVDIKLNPGQEKEVIFVLGIDKNKNNISKIKKYYSDSKNVQKELDKVKDFWKKTTEKVEVETPDKSLDLLVNKWLKYQAISCRIWGRAAYYQQSGAYGFRDQLQDSQIFLPLNSKLTKKQIKLHAEHQFQNGTVLHWWHPITDEGLINKMSDNLYWLPFLLYRYLKETADYKFLDEKIKYYDKGSDTLYNHCLQTFNVLEKRMSKRFLPLIGAGDWNDGLNAVGPDWKGESIWLGFFVAHIFKEWMYIFDYKNDKKSKTKYSNFLKKLSKALIKHGWDGQWFIRATKDNGKKIGSKTCKEGKIFVNPQNWAVISGIVNGRHVKTAMESVKKYIDKKNGSLLFYPAYKTPDSDIGYLTRYASGVRENGGVYFHAATWSIWSRSLLNQNEYVYDLYKRMSPILSGMKPDEYFAEPFVTPGNVDGVDSPLYGRGGWSWYTGSAAWFFTVLVNEFLGVKPEWKGLKITPHLPSKWKKVSIKREFRGSKYHITMINKGKAKDIHEITVNGEKIQGDILPNKKNMTYKVEVKLK